MLKIKQMKYIFMPPIEEGITGSEFFYLINDTYVECHKVNDKVNDTVRDRDEQYDISGNRQSMVPRILCEDIKKNEIIMY